MRRPASMPSCGSSSERASILPPQRPRCPPGRSSAVAVTPVVSGPVNARYPPAPMPPRHGLSSAAAIAGTAARAAAQRQIVRIQDRHVSLKEGVEPTRKVRKPGLEHFIKFVRELPDLSPRTMFSLLEEHGYRGQEEARRALCLMAYRHVRRVKRIYLDGIDRAQVPRKSNSLLVGPTG